MQATITAADLEWPAHCPVLGTELNYASKGTRGTLIHSEMPSLDRWDNSKGYVIGNVYVISLRANELKRDAMADEIEKVRNYMVHGVSQ